MTLWGQAHSATGYPLNAAQLNDQQKREIVLQNAQMMLRDELRTAKALGVTQYFSYAGYISPYVPGQDDYRDLVLVPTAAQLTQYVPHDAEMLALREDVQLLDVYPQDVLEVRTGTIRPGFISQLHYTDEAAKQATARYYEVYDVLGHQKESTPSHPCTAEALSVWMSALGDYMASKIKSDEMWKKVEAQTLAIRLKDQQVAYTVQAGASAQEGAHHADVVLEVEPEVMQRVIDKEMSFENLYTGFMGMWSFKGEKSQYDDMIKMLMIYAHVYQH